MKTPRHGRWRALARSGEEPWTPRLAAGVAAQKQKTYTYMYQTWLTLGAPTNFWYGPGNALLSRSRSAFVLLSAPKVPVTLRPAVTGLCAGVVAPFVALRPPRGLAAESRALHAGGFGAGHRSRALGAPFF